MLSVSSIRSTMVGFAAALVWLVTVGESKGEDCLSHCGFCEGRDASCFGSYSWAFILFQAHSQ